MRDFKRVAEVRATYHRKDQINVAKIKGSHTVNEYIRKIYPVPIELREAFLCLYLNVANNVQAYAIISVGGISSTTVDPKVIAMPPVSYSYTIIRVEHLNQVTPTLT